MPHPASIITLLTDFGDRDWFVASMKGVILSINPQATIVDLTHHIAPTTSKTAPMRGNPATSIFRTAPSMWQSSILVSAATGVR